MVIATSCWPTPPRQHCVRDSSCHYRPISFTGIEPDAALVARTPSLVNELEGLNTRSALVVITRGSDTETRIVGASTQRVGQG